MLNFEIAHVKIVGKPIVQRLYVWEYQNSPTISLTFLRKKVRQISHRGEVQLEVDKALLTRCS